MYESNLIQDLIKRRQEKGLSQKELANRIGIKQPQLSRIESGKQSPTLRTICLICDALGCSIKVALDSDDE